MHITRIEGSEDNGYVLFDNNGHHILSFIAGTIGHLHFGDPDRWEESTGTSPSGNSIEVYTLKAQPYDIDRRVIEQVEQDLKIDHDHPWLQAVIATWSPDEGQKAYDAALAAGADPDNAEAIVMCFDHFHAEHQAQQKQPCSAYTIIQAARCAVCSAEADAPFYCPDHK